MKTEQEIIRVLDWLGTDNEEDPCDDLPFIENIRAFREALRWVLQPSDRRCATEFINCRFMKR